MHKSGQEMFKAAYQKGSKVSIFEIVCDMLDELERTNPALLEQLAQKSLDGFVEIKDLDPMNTEFEVCHG